VNEKYENFRYIATKAILHCIFTSQLDTSGVNPIGKKRNVARGIYYQIRNIFKDFAKGVEQSPFR
jgi:hypothetical protein